MSIFDGYAKYYDIFYKDKDYVKEAYFINNLIKKYDQNYNSILDLGCGTGKHDLILQKEGYKITGVDNSKEMLKIAKANLKNADINYIEGDIRNINLNKKFDVIISLFHVFSYLISNEDLDSASSAVEKHLKENGIFVFDCWYGPKVLRELPEARIKKIKDDKYEIFRLVEPPINLNENKVTVSYNIIVCNNLESKFEEFNETHYMRYLFKPEIELFLSSKNFKLIEYGNSFIDKNNNGVNDWNQYFVVKFSN